MKQILPRLLCAAFMLILTTACGSPGSEGTGSTAEDVARLSSEEIAAEVSSALDRSADPCEDFYRFACGTWIDTTELPPDRPRWVRSFSVVRERNREVLRELIEQAASGPGDDRNARLVGDYFAACMDEQAVESAGVEPLEPVFAKIDAVDDRESLFALVGELHREGIPVFFGLQVFEDLKNPDLNIANLVQGGLGLPDRDYYLSDDEAKRQLLADYEAHVTTMFGLLGEDPEQAGSSAAQVVALETRLAEASRDRTAMRQLDQLYHRMDRAGIADLTPDLPWDRYFESIGRPAPDDINVMTPEFFNALELVISEGDWPKLKTYLTWHVVDQSAGRLPAVFVNADFAFYGVKLSGQDEIQPRWKRCVSATSGALGEVVGQLYVERMFGGDSKDKALEMIHDIEAAFGANLDTLAWMDDGTRGRAHEKLAALRDKIGYPDRWRDYSELDLSGEGYLRDAMAADRFNFDFEAGKIGEPVDKEEWGMTPQTVNAYFSTVGNEIVFPAGVLQPPFFHRDFPAAMNYGAIGWGIGHELTHGYDDQGRKFDFSGTMTDWWEPEVAAGFEARAGCVADFYGAYEVEPGLNVNGDLTLGENIADIGGLKLAHQAYKLWEDRHGSAEPLVEGLTNEQLVFVAAAQTFCAVSSPEFLRMQVTTDPHTPAQFRVLGTMSNLPAFAEAFGCEAGAPMRPEEQCAVW